MILRGGSLTGLTEEQVKERIEAGQTNADENPNTRTYKQIVKENTLTFFNFLNLVLLVLVLMVGSFKNAFFVCIIIINTLIGIAQEIRAKKTIDKLAILTAKKSIVLREGKKWTVPTEELVLDDVVCLKTGDQVPADARILEGSLEVNESLLTGEADNLPKNPGDELFSGSFVTSGEASCQIIHVGKDNYASQITSEAKEFKRHNSELRNSLNIILKVISIIIVPIGAKTLCFNNRENGLEKVLGVNASPNTINEVLSADVILCAGFIAKENQVIRLKLKQAAKNGAKVILVNPEGYAQDHMSFVYKTVETDNSLGFFKGVAKALLDMGKGAGAEGFDAFKASIEGVSVTEEAKEIAELYANAKKAMIVFQQNVVTTEAAVLLGDIAVVSGHIGKARDGILMLKAKNNSQGLVDLGITAGAEAMEGVKALLVFGEDPAPELLKELVFLMVCDTHMTEAAKLADVVIPGTGFASTYGTFTNTERRLQVVEQAIEEDVVFSNWEVAAELAHVYEVEMPFDDVEDISDEMNDKLPVYRYAEMGEIYGGVLACENAKLAAVEDAAFVAPLRSTDHLMNMIDERLPHAN